ncbi:MAG: hypothetical protein EHM72_04315 [Calditrichaeota bacterium]|nr:MAG: hypothetical protein EHM72_04315 [Calditrichota bacterium]
MTYRYLYFISILTLASMAFGASAQKVKVTFSVSAENMPEKSRVFITGNLQKLGAWGFRHLPLEQQSDGRWVKSVTLDKGTLIEFKFTRGDWQNEAVDSLGMELSNFTCKAERDTILQYHLEHWRDQGAAPPIISKQRMENKGGTLELWENWLYAPGDCAQWADPSFDDSAWQKLRLSESGKNLPDSWPGVGWFRLHVVVDTSVVASPLGFILTQRGAAEIYLDGKKLAAIGRIGSSTESEVAEMDYSPRPLFFSSSGVHLLAVRYSEQNPSNYFFPQMNNGFNLYIGELNAAIHSRIDRVRSFSIYQLVFSVIPLVFAVIHLLLFVFYPQFWNYLFYALSMLGFSVMAFTSFADPFITSPSHIPWIMVMNITSINLAIAFGMLSVYSTVYHKLPFAAFLPLILVTGVTLVIFFFPATQNYFQLIIFTLLAAAIVDMVRLTFTSRKMNRQWGWIIGLGFLGTLLIFSYQLLLLSGILRPIGDLVLVWMYAIPLLAVSLSIYISLDFAETHRQLRLQLVRVRELSDEAIEQERRAKDEEIQRRLLQADNERKTQELEDARQLQMSMLPQRVPQFAHVEIAVSMQTATEVGGDYYDFTTNADTLLFAVGDATGHGIKAGIMVASIKALFHAMPRNADLSAILQNWSTILHEMNLGNLYMAMLLGRLQDRTLSLANAGMPPVLWYHADDRHVEELQQKSMPLGGSLYFPYEERTFTIQSGDALLMMSDGFPELFNHQREELDMDRAKLLFGQIADRPVNEIIRFLNTSCDEWRSSSRPNDDITFVAYKF